MTWFSKNHAKQSKTWASPKPYVVCLACPRQWTYRSNLYCEPKCQCGLPWGHEPKPGHQARAAGERADPKQPRSPTVEPAPRKVVLDIEPTPEQAEFMGGLSDEQKEAYLVLCPELRPKPPTEVKPKSRNQVAHEHSQAVHKVARLEKSLGSLEKQLQDSKDETARLEAEVAAAMGQLDEAKRDEAVKMEEQLKASILATAKMSPIETIYEVLRHQCPQQADIFQKVFHEHGGLPFPRQPEDVATGSAGDGDVQMSEGDAREPPDASTGKADGLLGAMGFTSGEDAVRSAAAKRKADAADTVLQAAEMGKRSAKTANESRANGAVPAAPSQG